MKFYSSLSDVKYDLIVKSGASADDIKLAFEGVDKMSLKNGNLLLKLSVGEIVEEKPFAYQVINNIKKEIKCSFKLEGNILRFKFPNGYDKSTQLIIDPTLVFSSYYRLECRQLGIYGYLRCRGKFVFRRKREQLGLSCYHRCIPGWLSWRRFRWKWLVM